MTTVATKSTKISIYSYQMLLVKVSIATARAVDMRTAVISMSIFTASSAAFEASVAGRASSVASQSFAYWAGTQF